MDYTLPIEHYVLQFGFEFLLVASILTWAFFGTGHTPGWIRKVIRPAQYTARKPSWGVLVIFLAALVVRWATLPVDPIPHPIIHDEFCYLLQSDTFAAGKMTNPTHPLWVFFESMHIIHLPSYQAKYPPLQGLVLAAGQAFLGHPWYGVWMSCALMCGALCWALYGWLPRNWAFFGGVLCLLQLGVFNYWNSSYWGGSVAATGGALVLGALGRLLEHPKTRHGLLLAIGLAILANTRPYEGLLLALPVSLFVIRKFFKLFFISKTKALSSLAYPMLIVLIPVGFAMTAYFKSVTGNAFRMPYQVHQATYEVARPFLWQKDRPVPHYNHKELRDYWVDHYREKWWSSNKWFNLLKIKSIQILFVGSFYLGIALLPPLFFIPQTFGDRNIRPAIVVGLFCLFGFMVQKPMLPHYVAPQAAVFYIICMQSMRHMKVWRRNAQSRPRTGKRCVVAMGFTCFLVFAANVVFNKMGINTVYLYRSDFGNMRAGIIEQLEKEYGRHLVLVRYGPDHCIHMEWVYNQADIDNSRIVWARDMGYKKNHEILAYYADRKVWILEGDEQHLTLVKQGDNHETQESP